ncbi:MAG: ATP-dependent Clp protease proteolytic subunit [Candidatus Thorarchaeota archaeon]
MNRKNRMGLIKKLENNRGSKVLAYITGDRRGLETKIAMDVFPMFHEHLSQIGKQDRIDLFIYSPGGLTIAGYALVNLIREFCNDFNVIIPFKALSTATIIALGANEVLMTPMGQLSPIDPSVEHPLGPIVQIPGQARGGIAPVNVEDVNAFVDLARKEIGLREEESMKKVFELLAEKIHPLVLGAVHRSREQIGFLASNLMKYHCNDENQIENVVNVLTRERFSHNYIISRREAKENLCLNIIEPDEEQTEIIVDLFNAYEQILKLSVPYHPETTLGDQEVGSAVFNRGIIESANMTHVFRTNKEIRRAEVRQPGIPVPVYAYPERLIQEGWLVDNEL